MNLQLSLKEKKTGQTPHPYLSGLYGPVAETNEHTELQVIGHLPMEFEGSYFRNGPNPLRDGFTKHHWFDGDGMIHKIQFKEGEASYRNRFVRTEGFLRETIDGRKLFDGLEEIGSAESIMKTASSVVKNFLNQSQVFPPKLGRVFKDTANTDLIIYNGKLIPLWWLSGVPYQLDLETLETTGRETFSATYKGDIAAHARHDKESNELFFLDFGQLSPFVAVNCVGKDGKLSWRKNFSLPYPKMFHDLLFTKRFVVLMDFPFGFRKDPASGAINLKLDRSDRTGYSRIILIDRANPTVTKEFKFDPTYVLHGLNAFEDGEKVSIQVIRYPDPVGEMGTTHEIASVGALKVNTETVQWDLDLASGGLSEMVIDDRNTEFGRINDRYLGRKSRFSYQPKLKDGSTVRFDSIVKYDFVNRQSTDLNLRGGSVAEEPIFVPRKDGISEDDGWLGFISNSEVTGESQFLIHDAQSMDSEPVAKILFPKALRIPAGFHGKWHPDLA